MSRAKLALLGVLLTGAGLAAAEGPPYKRVLRSDDAQKAQALTRRIGELWAAGKFAEAGTPAQELLTLRKRAQGDKHWEVSDAARQVETLRKAAALPDPKRAALVEAPATHARAVELNRRGKYPQAEPLFRQALAAFEEVLGPKHPHTAQSYNNLAYNLELQGRAKEAEPLYRQALAIDEEVLGPKHPDTAVSCNNLASNLEAQGRAKEAEPLKRQALVVFEKVLGPEHPTTAKGYSNLAYNLQVQGRVKEAEPLLRKTLAVFAEEVLGPKHPHAAAAYHNLAINLQAQGRYKEAEPLLRKALGVYAEGQGPKHPRTASSYHNLAANLSAQGRPKEAEPLLRTALSIREEVLGPKHPNTALSYFNLGLNLQAQSRAREAEPLYRKAKALFEAVLGPKHPHTALSYHGLAVNLDAQGQVKEAEPLYRQALAIWEEVLGPKHSYTATAYTSLALNLQAQGRYKEAEAFWQNGADSIEAARLRLTTSTLDQAAAIHIQPHLGLAVSRARLDRPADAWAAAEAGLARGLLDDLAVGAAAPPDPETQSRDRQRAVRQDALDRLLIPLLSREKLDGTDQHRRDALLKERTALDEEAARAAAERSGKAVWPLAEVQGTLAADAALVFWVDLPPTHDHWGCVLRRRGPPAWVRLKGSGPKNAWTPEDDNLPRRLRDDLEHAEADASRHARQLAQQRLAMLAPHFAATAELPAVRHLVVVPVGRMAGIPVEALTDRYLVSYAPSGTVLARLRARHRPLRSPTLLALGDPDFASTQSGPPRPPGYGLYLSLVLPGGNAARAGLRGGDVLLSYGGTKLTTQQDLKPAGGGKAVPVTVWRDGKVLDDLHVDPGKLGIIISDDPPTAALRKRREGEGLADSRVREGARPLPGTRLEVAALGSLLSDAQLTKLLGSRASEQELDALAARGQLQRYRLVHLATHGSVDPVSARHSALLLARDKLPGPDEQAKLAAAGKKVPTGRLTVGDIADRWELDADLVTLSACQTALGPDGGGEGLLGFSQVLLAKGARSLVLSLWKVDDTATALLMQRFYQNLLGKRDGLERPLPKAEALHEAKRWLRSLHRAEVEALAGQLARGSVRADEEPYPQGSPREAVKAALPAGETPFVHPRYWAAFILIGDPD
jgi:tetratricopeptide (TPR) repeat protein